ncbi:MAG: hypothetical protein WD010_03125, partial [Nitriliruptor sp.]
PIRARYEGGPAAVERLGVTVDWSASQVRKSDADRAEAILAGIERAVAELPAEGLTAAAAVARIGKVVGYTSLLKKAKDAITAAVTVPDPEAEPLRDAKGRPQPDPDLRGQETVPLPDTYHPDDDTIDVLTDGVDDHLKSEVLPHASDAWVDHTKTKLGYEIPVTRIFYRYQPPRPLAEIDADIKQVEQEILKLLEKVTE